MKIELDLSNYITIADLKNAAGVDTSDFPLKKNDLANLKSDLDKLDIDKLKNVTSDLSNLKNKVDKTAVGHLVPAPVGLKKLRDLVKNRVAKKDVYNAEIKCIKGKIPGITNLPFNTALNAIINEVKNKVLSIINLVTNAFLNAKINMVKNEIPSATNIATTTALTAVDNKILTTVNLSLLQNLISYQ